MSFCGMLSEKFFISCCKCSYCCSVLFLSSVGQHSFILYCQKSNIVVYGKLLFRRAERNLFAQGHVKLISFFPVRDIPLYFIYLKEIFPAPFVRFYPIFVQTLRRVQDLSYFNFSVAKFFRPVISDKNFIFLIF